MYGFQLCKGDKYEQLQPCISINFLDFILFPDSPNIHHLYTFREYENHECELSHDLTVHYLELPKLMESVQNKNLHNQSRTNSLNMLEKWLYFIKEIDNPEDRMVQEITKNTPELDRTSEKYKRFMTNEALRWEAEAHEKWLHDQAQYRSDAIEDGKEEGLALGRAIGIAEGKAEGRAAARIETLQETAKKMLQKGLDISLICEITGLTNEELKTLQES